MSGRGQGRGRGRGQGRGRGRGGGGSRGRGGRGSGSGGGRGGRGGGRGGAASAAPREAWDIDTTEQKAEENLDINKDLKKFFISTASFEQHYNAQEENKVRYAAGMATLENTGVEVSQSKHQSGFDLDTG